MRHDDDLRRKLCCYGIPLIVNSTLFIISARLHFFAWCIKAALLWDRRIADLCVNLETFQLYPSMLQSYQLIFPSLSRLAAHCLD